MPASKPGSVGLSLRLDEDLHQKLAEAAKTNRRSLNSEMVDRLARSFSQPDLVKEVTDAFRAEANELLAASARAQYQLVSEMRGPTPVFKGFEKGSKK